MLFSSTLLAAHTTVRLGGEVEQSLIKGAPLTLCRLVEIVFLGRESRTPELESDE